MLYATGYNDDHWSYIEPVVLYIYDVLIQDTNGRPKSYRKENYVENNDGGIERWLRTLKKDQAKWQK